MPKTPKMVMLEYAASGERVCSGCAQSKPFEAFSRSKKDRLGIRSRCKACVSVAEALSRDPEKDRARGKAYRSKNPEKERQKRRRWRVANREKARAQDQAWRASNADRVKAYVKRSYEKKRDNPRFRLQAAVKATLSARLSRGVKGGRRTWEILGYTAEQLTAHLERQFAPGMSWENYGRHGWHIDHIIPLAAFNYETPDHIDFKRAWALSNLRPLWARDNWQKHAKLERPFQPSFAMG